MAKASFRDRTEAGRMLADRIGGLHLVKPLVFAVPKGGIPVARQVAARLNTTLDVTPGPEIETRESREFSSVTADAISAKGKFDKTLDDFGDHELVIVDDVIANGAAAISAIRVFRKLGAARILVAAPVVSHEAMARLLAIDNVEVAAIHVLESIEAVSDFFGDDEETITDDDILEVKAEAHRCRAEGRSETKWVEISFGDQILRAKWRSSKTICGVVLLLNTDREDQESHSAIQAAATRFEEGGLGTLSVTIEGAGDDINVLSHRVRQITNWLEEFGPAKNLPLGYFGVGTGGAAMLEAAAATPERVKALVSYEAPMGLARDFVALIHAPTLLVVKSENSPLMEANRLAHETILVENSLVSLSDFPEGIGSVAESWMRRYLAIGPTGRKTRPSQTIPPLGISSVD